MKVVLAKDKRKVKDLKRNVKDESKFV